MSIRIVMMWFTKFNTDFSARNKNIIVCKSKNNLYFCILK